jgi:Lrp/AsnC family leucine-responsive transcriptional regulator
MVEDQVYRLQEKDMRILGVLQENSRLGVKQISRKTGIPITTVFNRIKKLEQKGVIEGYKAVINRKKLGDEIEAFILINIVYTSSLERDDFSRSLMALPEVEECYVISGATNMMIKVSVKDIDALNEFIIQKLKKTGVENVTTYIILKKF